MTISELLEERSALAKENRILRARIAALEDEFKELAGECAEMEEMVFVLSRRLLELVRKSN